MEKNEKFSDWLDRTMTEQGRKYRWLESQININYHTIRYKVKADTFTYEEEKRIKEILK
jgi:hypothetical protein